MAERARARRRHGRRRAAAPRSPGGSSHTRSTALRGGNSPFPSATARQKWPRHLHRAVRRPAAHPRRARPVLFPSCSIPVLFYSRRAPARARWPRADRSAGRACSCWDASGRAGRRTAARAGRGRGRRGSCGQGGCAQCPCGGGSARRALRAAALAGATRAGAAEPRGRGGGAQWLQRQGLGAVRGGSARGASRPSLAPSGSLGFEAFDGPSSGARPFFGRMKALIFASALPFGQVYNAKCRDLAIAGFPPTPPPQYKPDAPLSPPRTNRTDISLSLSLLLPLRVPSPC
jgi:hypothetical protein